MVHCLRAQGYVVNVMQGCRGNALLSQLVAEAGSSTPLSTKLSIVSSTTFLNFTLLVEFLGYTCELGYIYPSDTLYRNVDGNVKY